MERSARWVRFAPSAAAALMLCVGCSSEGPGADVASGVAVGFHHAISGHEWSAACDLLAPGTVDELEKDAAATCADAMGKQDLPDAAHVKQVQVWGLAAQVRMDGDTVFLTSSGGRWRVTAAGCTQQQDRPYDCSIKGG